MSFHSPNSTSSTQKHECSPIMNSMTLAISHRNAAHMLEASRVFNIAFDHLQSFDINSVIENQIDDEKSSISLDFSNDSQEEEIPSMNRKILEEEPLNASFSLENIGNLSSRTYHLDSVHEHCSSPAKILPSPERNLVQRIIDPTLKLSPYLYDNISNSGRVYLKRKRSILKNISLPELLIHAALKSRHPLLTSYVKLMQSQKETCKEENENSLSSQPISNEMMGTRLLLFLDMDKSSKLLTAFEILAHSSDDTLIKRNVQDDRGERKKVKDFKTALDIFPLIKKSDPSELNLIVKDNFEKNKGRELSQKKEFSKERKNGTNNDSEQEKISTILPKLPREKIEELFRCFLSSISICIHHDENFFFTIDSPKNRKKVVNMKKNDVSPNITIKDSDLIGAGNTNDWSHSAHTAKEIQDISIYATDCVMEYVSNMLNTLNKQEREENRKTNSSITVDDRNSLVSFDSFGEWYNSGGYTLVPWLELLDLAKWEVEGKMARSIEAINSKHQNYLDYRKLSNKKTFNVESFSKFPTPAFNRQNLSGSIDRCSNTSPTNLFCRASHIDSKKSDMPSRTVISVDFANTDNHIKISEENLRTLKYLVKQTGLYTRNPEHVTVDIMHRATKRSISVPTFSSHESSLGGKKVLIDDVMVIQRDHFECFIRELLPLSSSHKSNQNDFEIFSNYFANFFSCYTRCFYYSGFGGNCVNAKELALGLSFLCSGNKSTKLSAAFDLLDDRKEGHLSKQKLYQCLRSYLTMLVGISFLDSSPLKTAERRNILVSEKFNGDVQCVERFEAVESGALWALNYFWCTVNNKTRKDYVTFDNFASWYTKGGYTGIPWLEFLDLNKFFSLQTRDRSNNYLDSLRTISSTSADSFKNILSPKQSSGKKFPSRNSSPTRSVDVLFTFTLANHQTLVVLREDASYVHAIVNQFSLVHMSAEEVWLEMIGIISSDISSTKSWRSENYHNNKIDKTTGIDQATFVHTLEKIVVSQAYQRKLSNFPTTSFKETLSNFFQSFDLSHNDCVAANQLMGGLILLCGGKKSSKLAFAFDLFDGRIGDKERFSPQSLVGNELFYFLRSFLIIIFSCCKQSLTLSTDAISRWISDTSQMVMNNIMKYQWRTRNVERINFDEFGEWYNEGGFEISPWLELLDLGKWVSLDNSNSYPNVIERHDIYKNPYFNSDRSKIPHCSSGEPCQVRKIRQNNHTERGSNILISNTSIEKTNRKDKKGHLKLLPQSARNSIDGHNDGFFDDGVIIDGIDAMDDMGFLFSDINDSPEKTESLCLSSSNILSKSDRTISNKVEHEQKYPQNCNILNNKLRQNEICCSSIKSPIVISTDEVKPLKFRLVISDDKDGCYIVSIKPRRIVLLKYLLTESNLFNMNISTVCEKIVSAGRGDMLSKEKFNEAMRDIILMPNDRGSIMSVNTQNLLLDFLVEIFEAFDTSRTGKVNVKQLASGFTILCGGHKSDKLEFAFELLDISTIGMYTPSDMDTYLKSFLRVLLSIASCPIGGEPAEDIISFLNSENIHSSILPKVVSTGSFWAAMQVFKLTPQNSKRRRGDVEYISFDVFADWYTKGGHRSIPWLELLDLRKWILAGK